MIATQALKIVPMFAVVAILLGGPIAVKAAAGEADGLAGAFAKASALYQALDR